MQIGTPARWSMAVDCFQSQKSRPRGSASGVIAGIMERKKAWISRDILADLEIVPKATQPADGDAFNTGASGVTSVTILPTAPPAKVMTRGARRLKYYKPIHTGVTRLAVYGSLLPETLSVYLFEQSNGVLRVGNNVPRPSTQYERLTLDEGFFD